MADGFDPHDAPVARGRRDPELALQLEAEEGQFEDNENAEPDELMLYPGDSVLAKVTLAAETPMGDGWFTYGVQSRVMDNESEEDTFGRVAAVVNTRVMNLGQDIIDRLEEVQEQVVEEQRAAQQRGERRMRPRQPGTRR